MRVENDFDKSVKAIRIAGIRPRHKPHLAKKADCTAEQWAAHLEWLKAYNARPESKKARKVYEARWLVKRGRNAIPH